MNVFQSGYFPQSPSRVVDPEMVKKDVDTELSLNPFKQPDNRQMIHSMSSEPHDFIVDSAM